MLLRSDSRDGDVEREWLGRASGWHFIAGISWILLTAIVVLGPALYYDKHFLGEHAGKWLSALTAATGAVTGLLGMSGLTPAEGKASGRSAISANIALAIAGPLFAVLVLILLSVTVDLYGYDLGQEVFSACAACDRHLYDLLVILVGAAVVMLAADRFVNINAFSIHAIYRNRLVRAFLGGARAPHRHPDGFTDFDWYDDLRVASLWAQKAPERKGWRPFHVINMTLNLSVTNNLAWQQRKAMPFTVTPFSCGNADLGYRPTDRYGGPYRESSDMGGISLGTAMAISGAAVSPNMGYHSSKSLSFLLTFFNVRLGCWLGNPGMGGGRYYSHEGPRFALWPLLKELFGLTSDKSPYVYLSDGGHFEDLGLYEMIRRRCKMILVVDGAQDVKRGYEDLGNAVRKIWIDLGVRISFLASPLLAADENTTPADVPYFALGRISYVSDTESDGSVPEGKILYIKPMVRGDEAAADVIAYKRAHTDFPQQSTGNQWFDEPQLESYRCLGYLMIDRIIEPLAPDGAALHSLEELFNGLAEIDAAAMK